MTTIQDAPLPSPPFFTIPNILNLRDAALHDGGLTTSSGQRIRPGVLFRSAEVSKLDREGWSALKNIGVGHVFDLRSKPEVEKGWKALGAGEGSDGLDVRADWENGMSSVGIDRTWVPVFPEHDYSPERLAERYMKYMSDSKEGFVQAYHDILTHAGPAFLPIYQYLAKLPPPSSQSQPKDSSIGALIHCTAGKDRTGMFFGILFSYLGVPASSIAAEYQLTELGLGHMREEIVSRIIQTPGIQAYMLSQNSSQEGGPSEGEQKQISPEALEKGRQAALRMMSARKESMEGALELVDREWGSAEGYLRNVVGLSDGELEGLRRCLVVNA